MEGGAATVAAPARGLGTTDMSNGKANGAQEENSERPQLLKNRPKKMTQCEARRADGRRCRQVCRKGRKLCGFHCKLEDEPAYMSRIARLANEAREKKKAEHRAQRKPINSVEEVKRLLGVLISEMRAAQAAPKDIASVAGAYLNAHTLVRDEETVAKIEEIHRQVQEMKLARTG